ncbi:MAG: UDP-N-acetylmuramoyl-L-alanyl-D-glutamate--2,6-diaminopimelate ligase [Bacilli bacterium]|nr:UDP-N-acetylmuramoyl-L-alanyl-D-glutamate--2,6-diaminopimelate ligase [Bacilli bacterium]
MDLLTLLNNCHIYYDSKKIKNYEISGIKINSHEVCPNDVFVAIRGQTNDGHDYIRECINKGVKTIIYEDHYYDYLPIDDVNMIRTHCTKTTLAVLANYFYGQPSKKINLIGVTGTNGKTSVTSFIYQIYRLLNQGCTLIGTNGMKIGDKSLPTENTTPNALVLQQIFAESLKQGITNAVMEVSSHAIKQKRISQLDFNTVILTNFSQDHLDYHRTMLDYFYTKGMLFASLGNCFGEKKVLLNGDDKAYKKFLSLTNVQSYTFGITALNDIQAKNIICSLDKISFHLYCFKEFFGVVESKLFGFFNIYNLLAALGYFYLQGFNMKEILPLLPCVKGIPGRMERIENNIGLDIFIDYAHTPESVYRILSEVRMFTNRRIILVIGCGGNRDELKRPLIGKIATGLANHVILTTDNPRFENPQNIIDNIIQGVINDNYEVVLDRSGAIKKALEMMTKDDILLILGKGHEDYQIINNEKLYFSDKLEVLKYLGIHS